MIETADVIRFKAGDEVPDWIFCVEPIGGGVSIEPNMRFTTDVVVYDDAEMIVIVPVNRDSNGVIELTDGQLCTIFSEAKVVRIATQQNWWMPRYIIPPGKIPVEIKTEKKPSAWWRRLWPF